MAGLPEQVRHDAASLYQFVCSIVDLCESRNPAAAYLSSSERFFDYLVELGRATKDYVRQFPGGRTQPAEYLDLRDEIAVLRAGWQFLHALVRPALESDTLHLPSALLQGLITRFREIPKYAKTDFTIFHTDEFNYLTVRLNVFKRNADRIAGLVHGPTFPEQLGLIGIPYSQSSSLFMNCLIPHEMGHYVFADAGLGAKFRPTIEQQLVNNLGSQMTPLERIAVTDALTKWSEELFCDLFAVRLVGFSYSLAFVELFDTSKALDENGKLSAVRSLGMAEFDEYPPDLFRVKQQAAVLVKDKWWPELVKVDSHYVNLLQAAEQMKDTDFGFPVSSQVDPGKILESFLTVVPQVFTELDAVTVGLKSGFDAWNKTGSDVETYLEHGVVPSSLLEKKGQLNFVHPDLVGLLNSSYKFYVESLDRLISHIKDADANDVGTRSAWAGKVQTWTAKAIEDVGLLEGKGIV
ncbi:MAG: hypothetical protein WB729_05505 [Candidatus Sulfotelmatobacter sp.]